MSAASARPSPAPTHTPSTLATTGTGQSWTASTTSPSTRMPSIIVPDGAGAPVALGARCRRRARSAPAQKSPPAPVSTTARAPE